MSCYANKHGQLSSACKATRPCDRVSEWQRSRFDFGAEPEYCARDAHAVRWREARWLTARVVVSERRPPTFHPPPLPAAMSRRQSRVSLDARQNDTLLEFENCASPTYSPASRQH